MDQKFEIRLALCILILPFIPQKIHFNLSHPTVIIIYIHRIIINHNTHKCRYQYFVNSFYGMLFQTLENKLISWPHPIMFSLWTNLKKYNEYNYIFSQYNKTSKKVKKLCIKLNALRLILKKNQISNYTNIIKIKMYMCR